MNGILTKPSELILTDAAWRAIRPLLLDHGSIAVGAVREHEESAVAELLVERLEIQQQLPTGSEKPPLVGWVVVVVGHESGRISPAAWLERIAPRQSQLVVVLTLSATNRGDWDGVVFNRGSLVPLDGVRIIGPGMLHLTRSAPTPLSDEARLRWSRTISALTEEVWRKVYDSHVILLGCGRNGTSMVWQLASLGVSRMTLVDGDILLAENLDAMPGMEAGDIGRPKVEALGRRLVAFRPDISIRCFAKPVNDVLGRLNTRADLIVSCVDDDAARLAANWLAREAMLTPHLDVGSSVQRHGNEPLQITGDVRFLLPEIGGGCVACVGGLDDSERCLYELAAPPGSLKRGVPAVWTEQRAGSLATINAITTATACQVWIDFLAGNVRGSQWHRLAWQVGSGLECVHTNVSAASDCRFCK